MKNENKNYYKVVCKCGHVGKQNYVPVQFAVYAENGKEAARMARDFPRVKHDHKDAILKVEKINYEQYLEIREINNNDPYLKCHTRSEQNITCDLSNRLVIDTHNIKTEHNKKDRIDKVAYKMKKNKILNSVKWEDEIYEYCY